jgi:hypothetical protein
MARPTRYTDKLGKKIADLISDGASLRSIGEMPTMPSRRTMREWLARHPAFRQSYDTARTEWIHSVEEEIANLADQAQSIAESSANPAAAINGLRTTIAAKQWLLSKLAPSVYGDRIAQEITGKDGTALMQPAEVDIGKTAMMLMAVLAQMPGAKNDRMIDHIAPQPSLPKPDPEAEARRLEALRTGHPVPAQRPSLGNADEHLMEVPHVEPPQVRIPAEDRVIDLRDRLEAERTWNKLDRKMPPHLMRRWPE